LCHIIFYVYDSIKKTQKERNRVSYREKELVDHSSIRKNFSKLLAKFSLESLERAFSLHLKKKESLINILVIIGLVASISTAIVTFGSTSHFFIIGSGGTVNLPIGVGFYWDSNCTNPVSFLDWGDIQPGSTINVTVFVRNEGSQTISLNITAENWYPIETASYMIFSIDYMGQKVNPQETVQITLSLTTSSSIEEITSFNFDINVNISTL